MFSAQINRHRWRAIAAAALSTTLLLAFAVARLKSDLRDELERAGATEDHADAYYLEIDDGVEAYKSGGFSQHASR
jgi:hypothetical protein